MYNYLSKEALLSGEAVVVLQSETRIENYKQITNQGELVECVGGVPAQWEYNAQEDVIYDLKDKPSPYHVLKQREWAIEDLEGFRAYCNERIDKVKAEILEYGFDYQGHQQRCRDKDIALMVATVTSLQVIKNVLGKDKTIIWYLEDNHGFKMDLLGMSKLMLLGTTFIQSIYDTENYFKTLETPVLITREMFEQKRKEIHLKIAEEV